MLNPKELKKYLSNFTLNNSKRIKTVTDYFEFNGLQIPRFINEFWTSQQRQSNSIHEVSYRACFKAELPRYFIKLLTKENDVIYDPFSGRGTTIIEAAILNRNIIANDINPLSTILSKPRLFVPAYKEVEERLNKIKFKGKTKANIDLSMFYHPDTEAEIVSLRNYLIRKQKKKEEDYTDDWIRMVATNRLTGHSKNFFSVYTLPPNQAVTPERQKRINKVRNQVPPYKNVKNIILKKTRDLTTGVDEQLTSQLKRIGLNANFFNEDARFISDIKNSSIHLTVTSPPFLDIVNYLDDNWLRCWFNNLNAKKISKQITITCKLEDWKTAMAEVFVGLYRITKNGGHVAFEVGEIRKGKIRLDEHIIPLGIKAGFECLGVVINLQNFTKTANIWGISNNSGGTNTNRIVLFKKI